MNIKKKDDNDNYYKNIKRKISSQGYIPMNLEWCAIIFNNVFNNMQMIDVEL